MRQTFEFEACGHDQALEKPPGPCKSRALSFGQREPIVHRKESGMPDEIIFNARGIIVTNDMVAEKFVRSQGPGGQNVNKVATAVELRLDAAAVEMLDSVRERLIKLAGQRATKEGVIVIFADRFRTQERNRQDARERLAALLDKASQPPPPPRRKTKPSKGAIEKRLSEKSGRSTVKRNRGRVSGDD
jgi:ribosome-associated protein